MIRTKSIIIGSEKKRLEELKTLLSPMVEVLKTCNADSRSHQVVKELSPEAVFIDIDGTINNSFDVARYLLRRNPELRLFFVHSKKDPDLILEALRLGATDFIIFPGDEKDIRRIITRGIEKSESIDKSGEIISVFSLKGGQGVTGIAANLVDHIHKLTSDKVILFDMNFYQSDVNLVLNMEPDFTPIDIIKNLERMDENLLFSSLYRHPRGFYVLSPANDIVEAEEVKEDDIKKILEVISGYLDYVVIDLPHDFSERSVAALDRSSAILLIVQQLMPSIKSAQKVLGLFAELGYPDDRIKIVLNRYSKQAELEPEDIEYVLDHQVFSVISNDYKLMQNCINDGKLLDSSAPSRKINEDIGDLAAGLVGISVNRGRSGFFKALLEKLFL